jgi:acyl-CoA synthetase (AMP-forming)/AMP-acid ligase II
MPVTHGGMQPFTLTLDKFLEHAAKWHPTTEVVTGRADGATDRIGYAGLLKRSLQTSAVLRHFGIRVGDCVATLAWNTQAHIEVWYAIMGMGAVCHTLNPRLVNSQLAAMVTQSQARILIVSADLTALAEEIAERASCIERLLIIDALEESMGIFPDRGVLLEPLVTETRGDTVNGGDFDETAPSALCFTSGTTGAPKGVTYTHRSSFLHTLRLLQTDVMGISAVDSVLAVVPMFHANAWGLPFAAPAAGAKLVLPGRHADGATLARLIAQEGVTIAVGVPTVWLGLVEHIEACGSELPTLERIIMGGAPLAGALMERLERRLGVTVQTSWGMTELSPSIGRLIRPPRRRGGFAADRFRWNGASRPAQCRGPSARARRGGDQPVFWRRKGGHGRRWLVSDRGPRSYRWIGQSDHRRTGQRFDQVRGRMDQSCGVGGPHRRAPRRFPRGVHRPAGPQMGRASHPAG